MKKQIKKSLSLFLAVLMLMTSWVWVAPEKAEAGAPSGYDVTVDLSVSNMVNKGRVHADIYYITNNGTGEKKSVTWEMNEVESKEGDYSLTYSNVPGWPCQVYIHAGDNGATTFEFQVKGITVNNRKVISGTWTFDGGWNDSISRDYIPNTRDNASADGLSGTVSSNNEGEWNWARPKLNTATATLTGDTHTLAKVNTGETVESKVVLGGFVDDYGVNWTGTITPTFELNAGDVKLTDAYASLSKNGNTATVTIKPWLQTLFAGKSEAKLNVVWSVNNGAKTGSEQITVTFPTYTATFYANGGTIGSDDSEATDKVVYQGEKMNIGSPIGKAPENANKPGFEFMGFYSKQNADTTGINFNPNGLKFEDNVTTVPAEEKGIYSYEPNEYGKFIGDTVWYAAWQAARINATFVTADNQLIGTIEGRHNNYMTATNMYNGDAGLNSAVKNSHTAGKVKFNANNEPIYTDGSTSYKFVGWRIIKAYDESVMDGNEDTVIKGDVTFQAVYKKTDSRKYTVSFEDGNGNIVTTDEYNYRDQIILPDDSGITMSQDDAYTYEFIGWANGIGKDLYIVDSTDKDKDGATIVYKHKDSAADFTVKNDATYVPVFRMTPREYKVTFNYNIDGGATESIVVEGYHWDDEIKMPEIKNNYTKDGLRHTIDGWTVKGETKDLDDITVKGNMVLTAHYDAGVPAEYTISFYGKDTDGETDVLLNADANIYEHGDEVVAPEVPQSIDTGDSLYVFAGWSPAVNATASGDIDYYATYTKKDYADLHFYNYDGTLLYELDGKENGFFAGETVIPEYENLVDGENVLPSKATDVIGSYIFSGWKNSAGNDVVPGTDKFDGNTYLYAQFETKYTEYRVRFVNEGEIVSTAKYHYGEEIEIPANPTKEADVEYIYDFRAWSPDVSKVCHGDATYTATYRRTPQYYKVTWLNDNKQIITESNYPYNGKINQPVVNDPVGKYDPPTGKAWAFVAWIQCDADGRAVNADGIHVEEPAAATFVRGQRMGAVDLYFYPTFELVDSVNTVTFFKADGTTLIGTAKIPYGKNIVNYADDFAVKAVEGYDIDADNHFVVDKWLNTADNSVVTAVTSDISVKAVCVEEAHTWNDGEVTIAPTCNNPGFADFRCTAPGCAYIKTNVSIAPLADEGKPTGQIYVGTDKWTLDDYKAGINYNDIKFVGPNTQLVVNAADTGSASEPWNSDGKLSRGVGKIEYALTSEAIDDPSTITQWSEIYNSEDLRQEALNVVLKENKITLIDYNSYIMGTPEQRMKRAAIDRSVDSLLASYKANATSVVSNLNLENGKEYVIYIKISDREGNGEVNTSYISSGTISYGTKAPEITISGEGYGAKFCDKADVRIVDDGDGLAVYLDGEVVSAYTNPGTTSANGTFVATFETEEAGLHTVTVIDKHGNKSTKIFEIKGDHTYRNYTTAATCEKAGSRYDLCTVCGSKANVTVLPAFGHSYTVNFVDKAAECIDDGYRTYVCDNNCGTKLVLKPTDDAATLAQAKVAVDPEAEEIEWRDLTAEDLVALKATGVHTYEKVKDENGEDTAEDKWVVDKAATCIAEGSKHKDCTKCGETVTDTIPADTVNGHKFYRERVTLEPTCTAKGEKTKTCRYCGYVEKVSDVDALGHTAGEYRIVKAATCEEAGSKILTCEVCKVDIGEEIKDADGKVTGFDGKSVAIPATNHAWKISGEVYKGEDGKYYQDYVCKNDATHTKSEEVKDYQPPVAAVITFNFGKNGGYFSVPAVGTPGTEGYKPESTKDTQTINAYVGETISANEVEKALKQSNETNTFSFSHWEDADGKEVKFPVDVKGDATYYAVFSEKFVNYTVTYYKEDGVTEYKKTGYLHNGDKIALADAPAKAATNLVTYKFAGWVVIGSDPEVVYTDEVTIDGANINLKAKYTPVAKKYAVTYAYSKSDILETFAVEAGTKARPCAIVPEKEADSKYHYEFKAWNRAQQLENVESNIYTTPEFEAILHEGNYVVTEKTPAACGVNRVDTYTCSCGYTYDKEIAGSALSHEWSEPVYDETTGKNVVTCIREGCGFTDADTRTFTVKFFVDTEEVKNVPYIPWGTTIASTRLPAEPKKESTATTDYAFKGWAVKGTTTVIDVTKYVVKADTEFVAVFEGTTREYSVVFAYDANNVIKTFTKVKAGSSVTFDGAKPVKDFDATYHYTFSNWQGYEAGATGTEQIITITDIQSDLYILAKFSYTKHTYDEGTDIGTATCTQGIGKRYTCTGCAKYYDVAGKPLDHDFSIEIDRKEATLTEEGYIVYKCATCPAGKEATYTKKIDKLESTTTYINVKVQDSEGRPLAGASVDLYVGTTYVTTVNTNSEGEVNFLVDKGESYSFIVEYDGKDITGGLRAAEVGEDKVNTVVVNISNCSCACHGSGIWSAIFRFFHKIIKMFTGEFKCCNDPDPRYN